MERRRRSVDQFCADQHLDGELVRVTDDGVVSLHRIPRRLLHGGAPTVPSPASEGGEWS
jgi:hypothetical protein